jgi:ATP-dependent RNA helicase DeaD
MDKPWKNKKTGDGEGAERIGKDRPFRENATDDAPRKDWKPKAKTNDAVRSLDDEVWGDTKPKGGAGKGKPARADGGFDKPFKKGAGKPFKGKAAGKDTGGKPYNAKGKATGGTGRFKKGDRAR